MIVLHYTGMDSGDAALARLCDPVAEVSCHYVIREDGQTLLLVPEEQRAWHAGAGAWGAVTDVNSRSVGIELVNTGRDPFPEAQMAALLGLLPEIMARWDIPPERVIGHSDCAPTRKADPGPLFDWPRLARAGVSIWPGQGDGTGDLWSDLWRFGYRWSEGEEAAVLAAFRSRFRPGSSGAADAVDAGLAGALARDWPVGDSSED